MNLLLASMLKSARIATGMTQQQVAEALNVKKNTISNYENGISAPAMDDLAILCDLYSIDMGDTLNAVYATKGGTKKNLYSASETALIDAYRRASDDDRAIVEMALRKYMTVDCFKGDIEKMA